MAANEIKLFGKWAYEGVTVGDLSVEDFIALKPKDQVSVAYPDSRLVTIEIEIYQQHLWLFVVAGLAALRVSS